MSSSELILIGAGGHSHACIDVIEQEGRFKIVGLVGVASEVETVHLGYDVLATDEDLKVLAQKIKYALITVGQIKSPRQRMELYRHALDCGFNLPTIASPFSVVSHHATVGAGTIVMHGVVVNAGAIVGSNCILNTNSVVEHDVSVGNSCHISTGAIINGNTSVGEGSFVGSGSVIKEGLKLGEGCVVGMGSCVRHHLESGTVFFGRDGD